MPTGNPETASAAATVAGAAGSSVESASWPGVRAGSSTAESWPGAGMLTVSSWTEARVRSGALVLNWFVTKVPVSVGGIISGAKAACELVPVVTTGVGVSSPAGWLRSATR